MKKIIDMLKQYFVTEFDSLHLPGGEDLGRDPWWCVKCQGLRRHRLLTTLTMILVAVFYNYLRS